MDFKKGAVTFNQGKINFFRPKPFYLFTFSQATLPSSTTATLSCSNSTSSSGIA